ncbi:MAG TPA: YdiU family protein [bacterium]|nr:YdiU family protein [bacterium]
MATPVFHRRFLSELPGDPDSAPVSREVRNALWSRVQPTPVAKPELLAFSRPLARQLGLEEWLAGGDAARVLGGNALLPGMDPYAANYGGHQFGHWAGQLGDGRAIVLGELETPAGTCVELQLKGAGPTAYSRTADGRAVLRSSIREFLCSEAMHALGVPTTRALSLVRTGDGVVRDMFYDGHPQREPGAIVCRTAPTFLRFGSYQLPASRGETDVLRALVEFTLRHWFPQFVDQGKDGLAAWLREVAERTARLVAHWQAIGFVHGVLNTDNMSILGLTIDYGPYGWIDDFDLDWTPNTTDAQQRRYAFGKQPAVGLWNLARLGEALLPLCDGDERVIEDAVRAYQTTYGDEATRRFGDKLGIRFASERRDDQLLQDLFDWLAAEETDMTIFFRALCDAVTLHAAPTTMPPACAEAFYGSPPQSHVDAGVAWLRRWWQRTRDEPQTATDLRTTMRASNPHFVLRNWLTQRAIDAAHQDDLRPLERLLQVMQRPFDDQPEHQELAGRRPEWARHKPGCSALSCSS